MLFVDGGCWLFVVDDGVTVDDGCLWLMMVVYDGL
jgi:hypothetical protein